YSLSPAGASPSIMSCHESVTPGVASTRNSQHSGSSGVSGSRLFFLGGHHLPTHGSSYDPQQQHLNRTYTGGPGAPGSLPASHSHSS
ncbi:unnamed protein product, partial [Amoebophrya sp. A25]